MPIAPALRRLFAALALGFALLVALGVHGYSLAAWHDRIDGSPAPEVLLGRAREIRSDDWEVILPLALAQLRHEPRFPLRNGNVGFGQHMLVPFAAPVAHPLAIFHPATWGFFLGADAGLAWMWWSYALGLFAVWLGVLLGVTQGRLDLAALGSLGLVGAPFFLFWGMRPAAAVIGGGLALIGARTLFGAERRSAILAGGALLGWAAGAFLLVLYPPFQVPIAWLLAPLLLASLGGLGGARHRTAWRSAALALALALGAAAALGLRAAAGDAIEALRHTSFPGDRISTGGDRPLWSLVTANLGVAFQVEDWGPLRNACEAAGFWLISPVVAAALLVRWRTRGARPDAVEALSLGFLAALFLYCAVGVPEWIARATGFRFVPGRRAVIGIGLAETLLVARFLANRARDGGRPAVSRRAAVAIAAAWSAALAGCAVKLARELPELSRAAGVGFALANGGLALVLLRARRVALPAAALAAAALASGAWWNPLVRGGAEYLVANPLSERILAIDRELEGQSVWLVFGGPDVPNLFRAIGVRALNGVHPVPQRALWQILDPSGSQRPLTNRYAHVLFQAQPRSDVGIRLLSPDTVVVALDPRSPLLHELGVTHVIAQLDERASFERLTGFEHLGSVGRNHLYRVTPQ